MLINLLLIIGAVILLEKIILEAMHPSSPELQFCYFLSRSLNMFYKNFTLLYNLTSLPIQTINICILSILKKMIVAELPC